jgi:hypothetical protein
MAVWCHTGLPITHRAVRTSALYFFSSSSISISRSRATFCAVEFRERERERESEKGERLGGGDREDGKVGGRNGERQRA